MGRKSKLVLVAGEKPQLRKASARDWSKAKAASFLGALAETCNVTEACRRSGVPMTVAYRRRKSDAAFRAGWLEAIGAAYQRLELVLLDRAFNGTEKVVKRRDGSEERMLEYSNQLGLTLLKMHRDTALEANSELPPENVDEIPSANPSVGSCCIVAASPTGAWVGKSDCIACFTAGAWRFTSPLEGMKAYVRSLSLTAMYRSGAWELGAIRGSGLIIEGERVVGPRLGAIAMPSGGSTIDAEARACVGAILAALEEHGLIGS